MFLMKKPHDFAKLRALAGLSMSDLVTIAGFSESTFYRWEREESEPRKAVLEILRKQIKINKSRQTKQDFSFIDLFAGIGGLRQGFDDLGGYCVFTSEQDKFAQATYKANYLCDHEIAGDITKIKARNIPPHDVLLAGFPCQPFSIAGVSKKNSLGHKHGFKCNTQGTLFFDVARIIEYHQPKVFLLENVKNLVNHDKGKTFTTIRKTLTEDLGYHVHWKIINAKAFVPQHRERIFIVGFKNKNKNKFTFDDMTLPDTLKGPRLGTIFHPENGSEKAEKPFTNGRQGKISEKYTLSTNLWNYLQAYAAKHKAKGNGFGFGLNGPHDIARTLSARYYKDGSEILIKQSDHKPPRRLTPRECARIMGFDKNNESNFVIPVSDTQSYKQFGNAVVVPVVKAVAQHMTPLLMKT